MNYTVSKLRSSLSIKSYRVLINKGYYFKNKFVSIVLYDILNINPANEKLKF
jgi:hypothetical protein